MQFCGFFGAAHLKINFAAEAHLRQPPQIGRHHAGDFRVAARGLGVGHQHNRLPRGRHLYGAERHGMREHFQRLRQRQRFAAEAVAHAVAVALQHPGLLPQRPLRIKAESGIFG